VRLSHEIRDDPTIDEATRLRNRIAELESLVRELRGAYRSSHNRNPYAALLPIYLQENLILAGLMQISETEIHLKGGIHEQPRITCNSEDAVGLTTY
jgi:hypothetical protein